MLYLEMGSLLCIPPVGGKYFIMRLPCKNRQVVHLHHLFSKALESAHLRFKRLSAAIAASYLTGRDSLPFRPVVRRSILRIQEYLAVNLV